MQKESVWMVNKTWTQGVINNEKEAIQEWTKQNNIKRGTFVFEAYKIAEVK